MGKSELLPIWSENDEHDELLSSPSVYQHKTKSPKSRYTIRIFVIGVIVFLGFIFLILGYGKAPKAKISTQADIQAWLENVNTTSAQNEFSNKLAESLIQFAPPPVKMILNEPKIPNDERQWGVKQVEISFSNQDLQALADAHNQFDQRIPALAKALPFMPNSRGIVMTTGERHLQTALVTIRLLRRTGSKLPVELFLDNPKVHNVQQLCADILPPLNVQCRFMDSLLNEKLRVAGWQYKIFAIIFSSFEDAFFLDADNLPVSDPEDFFRSKIFRDNGMILWPDWWASTVSPSLYQIQGKVPYDDKFTTESGQLLVSKRMHGLSLILAAYYNYYGPNLYYRLLSQGAHGEGDKETFGAAAHYLGLPAHKVKHVMGSLNYINIPGGLTEINKVALVQYNPIKQGRKGQALPAFIHHDWPKVDPHSLVNSQSSKWFGVPHRMWITIHAPGLQAVTIKELQRQTGFCTWGADPEKVMTEEVLFVACSSGLPNMEKECKEVRERFDDLFGAKTTTQ